MKKLSFIAIAIFLIFSLTACSSKPADNPAGNNAADASSVNADTEADTADDSADEVSYEPGAKIHSEPFSYNIGEDGTASIYLFHSNQAKGKDIVIPSEVEGVSITGIDNFVFSGDDGIVSVTIPDSITSIGEYAFNGCESVTLIVGSDSYAAAYAEALGLKYIYADAND